MMSEFIRAHKPSPNPRAALNRREVLPGLSKAGNELLSGVSPHQQWDEDTDRGVHEPSGHLIQAHVDHLRIDLAVELLVDETSDVVELQVEFGLT